MKNLNKIILAAAIAATLSLAANAFADGIAASPKVRQQLNEKAATHVAPAAPSVTVAYRNPADGVTASPKDHQMLAEQKVLISEAPSTEVASADGITASPKVRQQLDERTAQIIVAPLK